MQSAQNAGIEIYEAVKTDDIFAKRTKLSVVSCEGFRYDNGVSKGTKETGKGKEKRQRKVGEGTGKTGTAAEGTPENSRCPPCPARAFPAEYRQHFLKAQGQEEKAALRDSQPQPEKQERLPRFKHWLGKRTPYLAHIWRFRKRIAPA